MGDKVDTLIIRVDLGCCRCRKGIQDYLCRIQRREQILQITYDEKNNTVLVSGPFNPEELKRKLLCKLPKIIKGIDIKEPTKATKPPMDPRREKYMKQCEEEYEEITKCIEKCKKECEEKCRKKCEAKFKCKCKRGCKCSCECEKEEPPNTPSEPSPRMFTWPHATMVCCASPCPCFVAWCNNYRCCSCGVVGWPGWGSGQAFAGRPQYCGSEPSQPPCIVVESTPPCSIM